MQRCRVHITGASGSGTTTLGRALADAWSVPHADVDDYFWRPTVPPYAAKRPDPERLALMEAVFAPRDAWVLTGSLMGWGDALAERFDAVVFLTLSPTTRLARLRAREERRYGDAIAPGGAADAEHQAFLEWAAGYDEAGFSGRSRVAHDRWLAELPCAVLHLDSAQPVPDLLAAVTSWAQGPALPA